jgi:hypothetical protein
LKKHLLRRIITSNKEDVDSNVRFHFPTKGIRRTDLWHLQSGDESKHKADHNRILFQHDRLYTHHLLRINYTTYDIRRAQDVINSSTSHCNIIVAPSSEDEEELQPTPHGFKYARVLGVYHSNVIYTGPGGYPDHQPRRMEFLWVRWYENADAAGTTTGFNFSTLPFLRFPPMANEKSFGFVDPSDVLRACHLVPAFARGPLHSDGKGMSVHARDQSDWRGYYVMWYVSSYNK